ncbi:MAG: biopolymer transporter ExbD [Deltaproteobacteria bacterium]|nr:biopolymer transporter ExbD [Deltaproteobacteria bacterium]
MRFRRPKEEETTLGIAPLVDIVFLLLIFFMVTSNFDVASGVRIMLPRVENRTLDYEKNRIILVIDKSGQIYIEGQKVDLSALKENLEIFVREKGIVQVILQADKDVPHGHVVRIMDLAKTAGADSILIAAQWKAGKII